MEQAPCQAPAGARPDTSSETATALRAEPLDGFSSTTTRENVEDAAIRRFGQERHLPEHCVKNWLALGAEASLMLFKLSVALKLRTGQLVAVIEMLREIALREGVSAKAVLARPEIQHLIGAPGSAPERASKLLATLRVMRYPQLNRALEKLKKHIETLRMPASVAVKLPKELSSGRLVIELRIARATELDSALAALCQHRDQLALILELLGGADEF
jgi:hypothetical protein